jgi:hypothetical protein
MIVPSNNIKTGLYTLAGSFRYKESNRPFQGYYYEFNGKCYEGNTFNFNALEIIPISQIDPLLNDSSTIAYTVISGTSFEQVTTPIIVTIPPDLKADIRYFYRQINVQPITIKEITEESYYSITNNPFFQTTYIGDDQTVDQAEKQLPGLKLFLFS